MTNPARIIVLIVVPRRYKTSIAVISDSGIAVHVISAMRHSYRKMARTMTSSKQPSRSELRRLWIDI